MSDEDWTNQHSRSLNPTVRINTRSEYLPKTVLMETNEPRTRIHRGPGQTETKNEVPADDPMADPIAGWLVVTDGPGRGNSLRLGYGRNSIGRDANERISLDFGDEEISRIGHAILTYDPRGRQYYLDIGHGRNLTYIDGRDEPVLTPVLLQGYETIILGKTRMKFVPFKHDWNAE
jgi:hypothetical protein